MIRARVIDPAPEVAVAVVSWNTRELLRRCLTSLADEAGAGRASVWVVDNGSEDGSPELVESEFRWATLLLPGRNLGFGAAVNLVAGQTGCPWIAAANADVALRPGALEAMLAAGRRADAGAVAPRLLMADGRTQHSVHAFPGLRLGLALNLGLADLLPRLGDRLCLEGHWNPDRSRTVDWAHGALLLLRRSAFEQIGGFDPAQWMYAEDLDLCWRLARAGWRTVYAPGARADHAVGTATRRAFGEQREQRHLAAAYGWMARRRGIAVTRAYAALGVAGAGLRWLALALPALVLPGRFAARRSMLGRFARAHIIGFRSRRELLDAD